MTLFNFTFQESSPLISYSLEQWTEGSANNDTCVCQYNANSYIMTQAPGATATLSFLGTGISLFGAKEDTHGNFSVQVDQNLFIETGFRRTSQFNVSLFEDYGLEYGQHTVVITNMPSSNQSVLDLDSVSIERELGPPGYNGTIFVTIIDDTAPWVTYTGEWTQVPSTTAFEDTLHLTTQASAQVTVSFQGSSIELYGRYANAPFIVQLDNKPPMSLAGPQINLAPEQEHPQTLLYLMDALNEEQIHTVTLTNVQSNINRPFFFDYAIVRSSKQYTNNSANSDTSGFRVTSASSLTKSSSPSSAGVIAGSVIGGVLGFLFLMFCGVMLVRRYYRGNFFRRFSKLHDIMPFIIADLMQRQPNNQQVPCTTNHDAEKGSIPVMPHLSAPSAIHYPEPYGVSPYGTLYSSSAVMNQSTFDDASQLQRSDSTSTFISTSNSTSTSTSSSSYASTVKGGSVPVPQAFTLSSSNHPDVPGHTPLSVHGEDAGHRVTISLPPAYSPVWPPDSEAH